MVLGRDTIFASLKASLPVFFGYLSIGFAFGFLLVKAGFHWGLAPLMCITIYAGAAQYMAIGLLASSKTPLEMGIAIFFVNARHIVYGLSLLDRFKDFKKFKKYIIFGLTDETYALLTSVHPPKGIKTENFDFWIALFNQSYWILGSTIGALLGTIVPFDAPGLDFALTALFVVLTIEQIKSIKRIAPFIIPVALIIFLNILGLTKDILILTIVLSSIGCFFIRDKK